MMPRLVGFNTASGNTQLQLLKFKKGGKVTTDGFNTASSNTQLQHYRF